VSLNVEQAAQPNCTPITGFKFTLGTGIAANRVTRSGDNVEYIKYPTGSRHVYCFAYYVVAPPTSGTIVIRKEVSSPADADQEFTFEGNVSYTPDQRFKLNVVDGRPASMTFYRAAGAEPWTVREIVPEGWQLTGIDCTAGASTVTTDIPRAAVSIVLAASRIRSASISARETGRYASSRTCSCRAAASRSSRPRAAPGRRPDS
jgi:hypothetical protein